MNPRCIQQECDFLNQVWKRMKCFIMSESYVNHVVVDVLVCVACVRFQVSSAGLVLVLNWFEDL